MNDNLDYQIEKKTYEESMKELLEKNKLSPKVSPLYEELARYIDKLEDEIKEIKAQRIEIEIRLFEIERLRKDIEKILNG